ncbi:hypothetical protein MEQU1_000520 [Malassezia equina]|uniref:SEC7 domain-containing protein n=1 Tax=Malassezia equina TaxID=1381935 RepID=A0AAF0IXH4_9BASI|nr:hypothetical protein MEQU1_000520 [Malassezia equina]
MARALRHNMVSVIIEEVPDGESVSRIDDTDDVELDQLLEDDMFASAMGQRILAVSGHEVDDGLLHLRQLLIGGSDFSTLREFREQNPRRFSLYRHQGHTYVLPRLRDWELGPDSSFSSSTYHILPGGYVTVAEDHLVDDLEDDEDEAEEEDIVMDIDDGEEDDEFLDDSLLLDDDDYMDWLGEQLLKRKRGAPLWVIDDVHERAAANDLDYSLIEANQSLEEWENASMFLVEQDMAPQTQLFSPVLEMPESVQECLCMYGDKDETNLPAPTDECPSSAGSVGDAHTSDTSGLPFAVSPSESAQQLSKRLYQYTKQNEEYEGQTTRLLSSNGSSLLQEALNCYLERFHFEKYPIDMALRQFLSLEHLPLESQQVDRVLVAFSRRYHACNPDILDEESAYLLAFSLLLLHTDVFHKSVRPRISKAEFVSMTEASHVHPAILEYLYDNTSLVEFAYSMGQTSQPLSMRVDEITPLSQALCVYDKTQKDGILRLRVNEQWYLIQVPFEEVDAWSNRMNYIASLGSCALVWDDALLIPTGISIQMRSTPITVLGPLRTGAQTGHAFQPGNMYMECMQATSLALAQSVLSISMYLASHRQRHQTLMEEHQRQVHTIMHMGILTPMQRSTRVNLKDASTSLSQALRRTQIELTFLSCRIHFLQAEQDVLQERLHQEGLGIYTPV